MSVCFLINVYQNLAQAQSLIPHLPAGQVFLIDDEEDHIKVPELRGAWTERWLQVFLDSGCEVGIKIDPDVEVKDFPPFPQSDVFGRMAHDVLHGDLMGVRNFAAQRVINSGYLMDDKYKHYIYSSRGIIQSSQDAIFTDVMRRLNLSFEHWSQ